jgi:LmbE family N-acetylglucosaminyl deacetylase
MSTLPSRREFLPAVAAAAASPGAEGRRKLKVIVTGGHPGDPEYGCGGTIARYTDVGREVVLLYLNRGHPAETATRPASPVRSKEAEKACAILKARPVFAGQIDAHSVVDAEHYAQFRRLIADEKPDAVFTHWPIDNHPDHRAMSMLVYDAWLTLGRKFALYYYEVSDGEDTMQFAPTHYVDVTATEPRKRLACFAHASQAPERFYALQETVCRMRGLEIGRKYAEAYVRHIQSPDFPLALDA